MIGFGFDSKAVAIYTKGDCCTLAYALNVKYNLPVVVLHKYDYCPEDWCHMANLLPDGRIVDIEGIQDEVEFCQRWDCDIAGGDWARDMCHAVIDGQGAWFPGHDPMVTADLVMEKVNEMSLLTSAW